jgi:hypothetical protein
MDEWYSIPNCDYKIHIRALGTIDCVTGYQVTVEEPIRSSGANIIEFYHCSNYERIRFFKQFLMNKYINKHKDNNCNCKLKKLSGFDSKMKDEL